MDLCPVTQLQILSNGLLGLARITCSITVFLSPEKRSAGRLADGNLGLDWTAPGEPLVLSNDGPQKEATWQVKATQVLCQRLLRRPGEALAMGNVKLGLDQ